MPAYRLVIDQHLRYWADIEAGSPEEAIEKVDTGNIEGLANTVISDHVRVFNETDQLVWDTEMFNESEED